jgi:hypothetical protein
MNAALTMLLDASNYVVILMLVALGLAIVRPDERHQHGARRAHDAWCLRCKPPGRAADGGCLVVAPLAVGCSGWRSRLLIRRVYTRLLDTILATWDCR